MNFADRLDEAVGRVGNPCLVGIDPHLELLPDEFAVARAPSAPRAERAAALERFCLELVDVLAGRVAVVKPQSAFFEVLGADGALAWEHVVAHARDAGLLVIGDVKRNDIASTAAAYAQAYLAPAPHACDAITINPYLGTDSIEPFIDACAQYDAGLFVLVRTSNPGSHVFQGQGEPTLAERIANEVHVQGERLRGKSGLSSVGAVVGATKRAELASFRARMPETPFLLPGYGAQGASARDIVDAFLEPHDRARGALVNSSRGIAFAWRKHPTLDWKDAASRALDDMIEDLNGALGTRAG